MTHPVAGCRAKIARAHEHLKDLDGQIKRFLREKPDAVTVKFKFEEDWYIGRAEIVHPIPQTNWGLIIGDCVHNARSALDHLMWSITGFYRGEDPSDTITQFPIFAEWYDFVVSRILHKTIKCLPWYVQALIVGAQPYNRTHPMLDPLWLLHRLDIMDKHKFIPVTLYLPHSITVSNMPTPVVAHEFITGLVETGTPLVRFQIAQPARTLKELEMNMRGRLDLDISFAPIGPYQFLLARATLRDILISIEEIAGEFDALFRRHYGLPPSRG